MKYAVLVIIVCQLKLWSLSPTHYSMHKSEGFDLCLDLGNLDVCVFFILLYSKQFRNALWWAPPPGGKFHTLTAMWHFCQLGPKGALRVNSPQLEPHKQSELPQVCVKTQISHGGCIDAMLQPVRVRREGDTANLASFHWSTLNA